MSILDHFLNTPRYQPWEKWEKQLDAVPIEWKRTQVGTSVEGRPLWVYRLGDGQVTHLAWAQMHGNEPTATWSLLEIMNRIKSLPSGQCWALFPVVNPDGANRFERFNAQGVDLNRDAKERTQPESIALWNWIQSEKPHSAFNLHDQRSWFGIPESTHPATFSVLSARANSEGIDTPATQHARGIAGALAYWLEQHTNLPTTTFDDSFYPGAFGENVQASGIPVVLVESGSHPSGYNRIQQAQWLSDALIHVWSTGQVNEDHYKSLRQAETGRYDAVVRNWPISDAQKDDVALLAVEIIQQAGPILFWEVVDIGAKTQLTAPFDLEYQGKGTHPISVGDRMDSHSIPY
jgi:hypothetical protein